MKMNWICLTGTFTVKPVLSGHSKIDKTKILETDDSLMQAESIAECYLLEHSAILLTCIKRYSVLKTNFGRWGARIVFF